MPNNWLFFMDLDGGSSNMLPMDPLVPHTLGAHLLSHISSFVDSSLYHARFLYAPGSLALREAFNSVSKFAGALLFWFASGSNSNINRPLSGNSASDNKSYNSLRQVKQISSTRHNLKGFHYNSRLKGVVPMIFGKVSSFTVGKLCKQAEQLQYLPLLSLAAALVPPLDNVCPSVLAIPLENCDIETKRCMNQRLCDVEHGECSDLSFRNLNWTHAVEPRTGIEFPTILENILSAENHSKFSSEVGM
ncbi:unnamed protein product [Ilex paraguariensis]|uniref:FZ domain-containing protein n=1 Tax=Ilex paraguariensis TaxID=185542 RepID=A0ABC8S7W7_9AQUA